MRRTCNLAAVLLAAGLTLTACGGGGDDDTVAPAGGLVRETLFATATTVPPAAPVDGPVVLDELTGKLKAQAPDAFVEESTTNLSSRWARTVWLRTVGGTTDGQVRLDVYAAPADRDSWVAEFRGAAEAGAYLIVGDAWTAAAYNADDAATAQRLLGGELIAGGS
ncbi:hypothetical protein [Glutamicibacter sp. V16R2B1]|uniref:hypothetical protein n=1 Tax=Glutamicibacter sp. V16R2B1 TaxID=2036207 RepID=UPI0010FD03DA|nr:hypothetical protein [Glutamicibacter sp. V16R2B1]MCK9901299.1 hypothetical protein [Frankia sp. Cpl3]TLK47988.1 hypothetical protein FDN03_15490 [Glutamicibacter sp. V16R2B1]